jgi:hypothetical protein
MKTINVICSSCGKETPKPKNEINRHIKNGRTEFYCSRSCAGKSKKNIIHLKQFENHFVKNKYVRQTDKYSNFRWYMKVIRKNSKHRQHEYNIDCKYLKQLWDKQNGICPFTNKKLILRTHSNNDITKSPYQASLDRIDNSIGYVEGNVRFVALIYNYAKNTFSDQEVIDFCKTVAKNF